MSHRAESRIEAAENGRWTVRRVGMLSSPSAENRIAAGKNGSATILGHPDVTVPCHIRDFSRSGLCITVEEAISFGKIVKVEWDDHFLVGRVLRVSAAATNFRVGLELLYCSKWNQRMASILMTAGGENRTTAARQR